MPKIGLLAAISFFLFAAFSSGTAMAGHDGDFDPCAGLRGSAFGLCHAYTHAMQCGEEMPAADDAACDSVARAFMEATGDPVPSDCPCNFSLDRIRSDVGGWDLTESYTCLDVPNEQTDLFLPPVAFLDALSNGIFEPGGSYDCVYLGLDDVSEHVGLDESTHTLDELRNIHQACRGAILTLARNVMLTGGSNCPLE
jgi:hypothetical protein